MSHSYGGMLENMYEKSAGRDIPVKTVLNPFIVKGNTNYFCCKNSTAYLYYTGINPDAARWGLEEVLRRIASAFSKEKGRTASKLMKAVSI